MNNGAGAAFPTRFSPRLTPWLAFGWTAAIALLWLFRYEACLVPVQLFQFVVATVPTLRLGSHFGRFWADAVVVAGILLLAFWLGAIVVGKLTTERGLLVALIALAIGLWILAVAVLIVGSFSTAKLPFVFALAVCFVVQSPRSFFRDGSKVQFNGWVALIIVAALLNLLGALAPPFEYDELEYHLGAPSEYLKAGRIIELPHNFYSDLPQLTEMLYLLAMKMTSDGAAKLLHWSFGLLAALAVYAVAAKLWSRRIAQIAAALFYCLPFVQDLSQTARIDLATTFFATLAFGALLLDWWVLAAAVAGCAVATKWPAVAVVWLPAVLFLATTTKSLRRPALFAFLSSLFILPWLLKNWLLTGNPVYPLFFGGAHWSDAQAALFAAKHEPQFAGGAWRQLFERVWHYSFVEPGAVPVLLMTAPLLLLWRNTGTVRRVVWLFAGAYLGWYLLTFRPWRFLFPALPLAAITGAVALNAAGKWTRVVVMIVVAVGLASMGTNVLVDVEDPRQFPAKVSFTTYALGEQSREEFVTRLGHGVFEPIVWMNHNLSDDAKVLYVGEARTHYARHPVIWSTAFDQHPLLHGVTGATHIYINFSEWERLRVHYNYLLDLDGNAFRKFLKEHARIIHEHGRGKVYELTP